MAFKTQEKTSTKTGASHACMNGPAVFPASTPLPGLLAMQSVVGNQRMTRLLSGELLQPKLRISQPSDPYEREADRVAEAVVGMSEPGPIEGAPNLAASHYVQRKCAACEEEELQRKPMAAEPGSSPHSDALPAALGNRVQAALVGGDPLPESTRAFFEPRFGRDFSRVRVHSDSRANEAASAVEARAFTLGRNIVFGAGQYAPQSAEGQRLLAHELAHVGQQGQADRICRQAAAPQPTATSSGPTTQSLDLDDQKIVDTAKRETANFKCNVWKVLWGILHKYFSDDKRKLAGTGCEAGLPGLRTDFTTTNPKDPTFHHSAPMMLAGKAFIAFTDATQLKQRVADIAAQFELIDDWRLKKFLIDERDLTNNRITGKLRSFSNDQLQDYSANTKDSEVKRYVENLVTFSTPTQVGAAIDPITGNMEMQIGIVRIVIERDIRGAAGVKGGDTAANLKMQPQDIPSFKFDAKKKVTDFPGYSPVVTLKILTRYEAGSKPEAPSAYGRGTAPEDIRNKATSLRFHEGAHGEDFVDFVRKNPFPVFEGKNGDKVDDFLSSRQRFLDALSDWGKRLDAVKIPTECVGKSIDEYHKGEKDYKPICTK